MSLHPRYFIVGKAKVEFTEAVEKIVAKHDLTIAEVISMVAEYLSTYAKYRIRAERHPNNPDKGGDES